MNPIPNATIIEENIFGVPDANFQPVRSGSTILSSPKGHIGTYQASHNTLQTFKDHNFDNQLQSTATQSSAIRGGNVMSPHIYEWNATPVVAAKSNTNSSIMSGMSKPPEQIQGTRNVDAVQQVRDAISACFTNANMLKTHQYGAHSVYKCPVENMTGGDYKYIVAIVSGHEHIPLGSYYSLKSLPWVSFQTRSTSNPAAEFGPVRPAPLVYTHPYNSKSPLMDKIKMAYDDSKKFTYIAETIPCKIEYLKNKSTAIAAPTSTVMAALDTFRAIITFIDQ